MTHPTTLRRLVPALAVALAAGALAGGSRARAGDFTEAAETAETAAPQAPASFGITDVGGIARTFQIVDRTTRAPVRLADFDGQVVVLDFFAYWCGPCRASSPDLHANVKEWYAARGGNPHGVPVAVIPVNVESDNESATDSFIRQAGINGVANDYANSAYSQFATGFIPLFVIINGVADSPTHRPWEVLYRDSGYPGAPLLRSIIDRVRPPDRPAPPRISRAPLGRTLPAGSPLRLEVLATGKGPLRHQWLRDGRPLPGPQSNVWSTASATPEDSGRYQVRVGNDHGATLTSPVDVRIIGLGTPKPLATSTTSRAIPDNNAAGITSTLAVSGNDVIGRVLVSFRINHTYPSDLRVSLRGPDQQTVLLFDHEAVAGTALNVVDRGLGDWGGVAAAGTWALVVADQEAEDVGSLVSWSLAIQPVAPPQLPAFPAWIATFPGLTADQRLPGADPDFDGYPNLVEYRLHGRSPVVAEPHPIWYPNGSGDLECVFSWRDGTTHAGASVWWTDDLARRPWSRLEAGQPAQPVVDAAQAFRTVVRAPGSHARSFLLLRYDAALD